MPGYTYICTTGEKSQVLYYVDVPAPKPKASPLPASGVKPTAVGQAMEAWSSTPKTPADDTVEGGLYKCALNVANLGGSQTVFWIIDSDGRSKNTNEVVGRAIVLKSVGSVLNPTPIVVPVLSADGNNMGGFGKRLYYFAMNSLL